MKVKLVLLMAIVIISGCVRLSRSSNEVRYQNHEVFCGVGYNWITGDFLQGDTVLITDQLVYLRHLNIVIPYRNASGGQYDTQYEGSYLVARFIFSNNRLLIDTLIQGKQTSKYEFSVIKIKEINEWKNEKVHSNNVASSH